MKPMVVPTRASAMAMAAVAALALSGAGGIDVLRPLEPPPAPPRRPGPDPGDDIIRTSRAPRRSQPRSPETPIDHERLRLAALKRARKAEKLRKELPHG